MNRVARKNILKAAKDHLKSEILDELDAVKHDLVIEIEKDDPDRDLVEKLQNKARDLVEQFENFGKSKRAKKRASIEWKVDDSGSIQKPQKKRKVISDWDTLRKVQSERSSSRPRAKWLQEGILVVHKDSQMPMMVLSIANSGTVQCLAAGEVRHYRDVSLRPALDETE